MSKLHVSNTLSLPLEITTLTEVILAKKGSGKTYTAAVLTEELLKAHQQVVIIDPTGAWFGLKSSADGKREGFPIAIVGGEHADVPLEESAGEVIATAIVERGFSCVLDLSLLRKAAIHRFMGPFLEALYRLNRNAMHLVIDEADTIAPQKPCGECGHIHIGKGHCATRVVSDGCLIKSHPCKCTANASILPVTFMLLQPQSWHEDVWSDVTRMRTLNGAQSAKGKEMHLCPMQFDIADRIIAQFSMEGEVVYDPFGGLMTVPMRAVMQRRFGVGCELNPGYFRDGVAYVEAAAQKLDAPTLFDVLEEEAIA